MTFTYTTEAAKVREFAQWLVAFADIPAGQRNTTMNEIIVRAKTALGMPATYEVTAGASDRINDPGDVLTATAWDQIRGDGADLPARLALYVLLMDDPDVNSAGGDLRRRTTLSNLVEDAKIALGGPVL